MGHGCISKSLYKFVSGFEELSGLNILVSVFVVCQYTKYFHFTNQAKKREFFAMKRTALLRDQFDLAKYIVHNSVNCSKWLFPYVQVKCTGYNRRKMKTYISQCWHMALQTRVTQHIHYSQTTDIVMDQPRAGCWGACFVRISHPAQ